MCNEKRIQDLVQEIENLFQTFSDLPVYEVGFRLIAQSTKVLLSCAPKELVAVKTIMASVEVGISEYQQEKP